MIYLFKLIACSALFLLVYFFLLQREKMFGFNRVFLLTGLILPFFIPLMTFDLSLPSEASGVLLTEDWVLTPPTITKVTNSTAEVAAPAPVNYLLVLYLLISGILLLRFVINLLSLWRNIRSHEQIPFLNGTLVLLDEHASPHSFMGYILVNKEAWQAGRIDKEILYHEYLHGKLFHSVDILLVELVQIFCWFNPVLYFYKRAIALNHEFEADDRVLKFFNDRGKYQYLLIHHSFIPARGLCHSFNFIHLKKRIRMISTPSKPLFIQLYTALASVFIGFMVFLFAEKTFSQQIKKTAVSSEENTPSAKHILEEFDDLASRALIHKDKEYRFTMAETNRLGDLFIQMTSEEKLKRKLILMDKKFLPKNCIPLTQEEVERFKDSPSHEAIMNTKLKEFKNDTSRYDIWYYNGVQEQVRAIR